jgi:large subunit ribosomal protein L25
MAQQGISLKVEERTVINKGLNALREAGKTPAVVHDHGQPSKHIMASSVELEKAFSQAGKHHPVEVILDGKKYLTIIKDVDTEPVKNKVRHIVFQAIKQNEKVETEVPIQIIGDIPAEKAGLMVIRQLDHIQIEALPKDLIDVIEVSAEKLIEIGDNITVADLIAPQGVTILTESEHGIAVVEETKAQESEEANTAEDEAEAVAAATGSESPATEDSKA